MNEELEKLVLRRIVEERNHQGKDNLLLFPSAEPSSPSEGNAIKCKQRLGGMLKYCYREAA